MLARAASERSEARLNRARTGGHERAAWMMPCAGLGGAEPARDRDAPRVLRLLRNRRAALPYQDREFGVGDREHRPFYIDVSPSVIGSPVAPSPAPCWRRAANRGSGRHSSERCTLRPSLIWTSTGRRNH